MIWSRSDPVCGGRWPYRNDTANRTGVLVRYVYVAEVIVLEGRPVIRIRSVTARGRFLVGYFAIVDAINDRGRPIDLADVLIECG